jgi:hypothetical protein
MNGSGKAITNSPTKRKSCPQLERKKFHPADGCIQTLSASVDECDVKSTAVPSRLPVIQNLIKNQRKRSIFPF